MCAWCINCAFVQRVTFFYLTPLQGQTRTLQVGLVLSGREGLQLPPQSGGQGEHFLLVAIHCCLSCFFVFSSPRLRVLVAAGAAADARGPGAGSGPFLRLGRGLRGRKSGLPRVPLHPGGAAQGAEPHLPADRHQAGEGARLLHLFAPSSACFFSTCLGCKDAFRPPQDTWLYHLAVAAGSSSGSFKVGTEYEQLIGQLLDAEGDPGEESQPSLDCVVI